MNQQNGYQKDYNSPTALPVEGGAPNEEIDLINYLKVLLKRKWFFLLVFLFIVIVVAVISWSTPKTYKIDTSLEIGKIAEEVLEPHLQAVEKINSGIYGGPSKMKVSSPDYTNIIKIETLSEDPQKAVKDLENMNDLILTEHNNKINLQKNLLDKAIGTLQEKINFFIAKKQESEHLQLEINNLQMQKEILQPTKVIKEPTISEKPIRPKIFLNIVIAAVFGFFIGIFLVFFKEWWDKNKGKF